MKKVKDKYIRLTETQLHKLIKEEVEKNITRILNEYADPRKVIIKWLRNFFEQLIENWCLVHTCTITNTDINQCKNHWKQELWTILSKMGSFKLQGNNSYDNRVKVIETAEKGQELLTDFDSVYGNVIVKFAKEKIEDEELISSIIKDLTKSKKDIIHIIANYDKKEIKEYVNTI